MSRRIPCDALVEVNAVQPLPDPVATFGAELVTAPSTPVLSSSMADPDPLFISKLHERIENIASLSPSRRLRRPILFDLSPLSSSDSDEPDVAPWSLRDYAAKLFERAARKQNQDGGPIDGTADLRRPAKRQREQDATATATSNKRARHKKNGEQILERERAIDPVNSKRRRKTRLSRPQQLHSPAQTDLSNSPDDQISTMSPANTSANRSAT